MAWLPTLAWLWTDPFSSDVRLHLRTQQHVEQKAVEPASGGTSPGRKAAAAPDSAGSPATAVAAIAGIPSDAATEAACFSIPTPANPQAAHTCRDATAEGGAASAAGDPAPAAADAASKAAAGAGEADPAPDAATGAPAPAPDIAASAAAASGAPADGAGGPHHVAEGAAADAVLAPAAGAAAGNEASDGACVGGPASAKVDAPATAMDPSAVEAPVAAAFASAAEQAASQDAPNVGGAEGCARAFSLHSVVLASCSPYFKARLIPRPAAGSSGAAGVGGVGSGGGGELRYGETSCALAAGTSLSAGAGALLLVEYVEEGELDAMEALLRHCYTGQLCGEGEDAAQLSVAALLRMMALANRFDVPLCLAHCCEELAKRTAEAYDIPAVNGVLAGLTTAWHSLPAFSSAVVTATERLLQLLGDAEAVCGACCNGDATVKAHLRQLSQPSLLVLLSSAGLMARSENSVLMMVNDWVACTAADAPHSEALLRQVVEALRLAQLSHVFLHDILPQLPWLKVSSVELDGLRRFAAALAGRPAEYKVLLKQHRHDHTDLQRGPAGWYAVAQRAAPPGISPLTMSWDVTKAELARFLRQDTATLRKRSINLHCPLLHFYNGFTLQLTLVAFADPAQKERYAHAVIRIGPGNLQFREGWMVSECGVVEQGVGLVTSVVEGFISRSGSILHFVDLLKVPDAQVLELAAWEPYLVDGKLTLSSTVTSCA